MAPLPLRRTLTKYSVSRAISVVTTSIMVTIAGCAAPSRSSSNDSHSASTVAISLDAAIGSPSRSERARARDVYRHPKETLQFFELAPTQTVLEVAPGGGWYTDILAPYLHDAGRLYEAQYVSTSAQLAAEDGPTDAAYLRKLADAPAIYGNVVVGTLHAGEFTGFDANERDTKDYPHGVWSLPPTYEGGDVDRARYAAIGESDRMTLRFVKR